MEVPEAVPQGADLPQQGRASTGATAQRQAKRKGSEVEEAPRRCRRTKAHEDQGEVKAGNKRKAAKQEAEAKTQENSKHPKGAKSTTTRVGAPSKPGKRLAEEVLPTTGGKRIKIG